MSLTRSIALLVVSAGLASHDAFAQGVYGGLTVGYTPLETPTLHQYGPSSAPVYTAFVGHQWRRAFQLEARLSHVQAFEGPTKVASIPEEPPYARIHAALAEGNVSWVPDALRAGRVQGYLSAGPVLAIRFEVKDTDTGPVRRKGALEGGFIGSAGANFSLSRRFALTGRASYRKVGDRARSPSQGLQVRGAAWDAGVRFTR